MRAAPTFSILILRSPFLKDGGRHVSEKHFPSLSIALLVKFLLQSTLRSQSSKQQTLSNQQSIGITHDDCPELISGSTSFTTSHTVFSGYPLS